MTTERDLSLRQFRTEYGRMCVLTAQALTQGHNEKHVMCAARGLGFSVAPVYTRLRAQRALVDVRANRAHRVGVTFEELIKAGYQARSMVEGEWMLELPTFAEI